jgi:hypothetical protein
MARMSVDPLGTGTASGIVATSDALALLLTDRDESEVPEILRTWRSHDGWATGIPALAALRGAAMRPDFCGEGYFDLGALFRMYGMPMPFASPPLAFFGWTGAGQAAGQVVIPNQVVTLVQTLMMLFSGTSPI